MKKIFTAQEIYEKLIYESKIKQATGLMTFHMSGVSLVMKRRDVIGWALHEWVEKWMKERDIDFLPNPTITAPDIFLNPMNLKKGWLEIKAFNYESNPRFSLGEFISIADMLIKKPWYLETDFLIFGYQMDEQSGEIWIVDLWLKKLWEIEKPMTALFPLTVKSIGGIPKEVRPCMWYAAKQDSKVFECVEDFLSAFEETVYQNPETRSTASQWKNKFLRSYRNYYGNNIKIPRWDDIRQKYGR